jgi:glycosyltransferase involved in cell wall biosynthesis
MWRYWSARKQLRRILLEERPEVVHSNDLPTHQMVSDAARGTGIPRFCHHRFVYSQACLDWLNKFGADRHLFISHSLCEELTRESPKLRQASSAVVYDGIPLPDLDSAEDRRQARARLELPLDRLLVLFAGQVVEVKGVADLLRAWQLLWPRWRDRAELIIAGDDPQQKGAYRIKMEALARELDCPVRFVGFQRDIHAWQMTADIAVVPSHVEPLGLVALEAMALELPVVGCAVGGIRETVIDQVTGLLVPPRSPESLAGALDRLLADDAPRITLGQAGRQRCREQFSLRLHTKNVLAEYRQVTQSVLPETCAPILA